jgi:hypothetical protein
MRFFSTNIAAFIMAMIKTPVQVFAVSSAPFQGCAELTDTRLITINQCRIAHRRCRTSDAGIIGPRH